MAKKTAKSKGYRSYKKEKPFLTKKELYVLIAICAVILAGFIAFMCYDDRALKIDINGAIEGMQDNWIVANCGTGNTPRYFKLAEAGEVEGYTILPYPNFSDYRLHDVYYYAADESEVADYISIGTSSIKNSSIQDLGATVTDALKLMEGYTLTTELTEAETNGIPYAYYGFTSAVYVEPPVEEGAEETAEAAAAEEEAAEKEPNSFGQSVNAYVETAQDTCLLIHLINNTQSADEFLPDEELKAELDQIIAALKLEEK